MALSPLTSSDIVALSKVVAAEQAESRVRFIRPGTTSPIVEGTVRHDYWTAEGLISPVSTDIRSAHVRITLATGSGMDVFEPVADIVLGIRAGLFAIDR